MSTPPFSYSAQFLASIERTVSKERLGRYLKATNQDWVKAVELYEYNVALSEMLFGYLHGLEVAVRNAMHQALTNGYNTPHWYDHAPIGSYLHDKFVKKAKQEAGPGAPAGKVVAELSFGFWTALTSHQHNWSLWKPYVRLAFPNATVPRQNIHRRLETIRYLRNRIAHHEPILTSRSTMYAGYKDQRDITLQEIGECAEWVCRDTARWLETQFRYHQAAAILAHVSAMTVTL